MKTAAFFDLDGTLLTVNSAVLWIKREHSLGRINLLHLFEAAFLIAGYRFGVINMDRAIKRALRSIRGEKEQEVRRRTQEWFEREITPHVAPGGRREIERHREEGRLLVLLTSSSPYESEIAARYFDFDVFLCTRYEVVDGRFTGRVSGPLCFGPGKVTHAEQLADEHGIDLDQSYFFTDSITDLPMLERVGQPHTVHPDPRLRRTASKRGWPILDWRS